IASTEAIKQFTHQHKQALIINTSTLHHTIPSPNYLHYPSTKRPLKLIIQTMSIQYPHFAITINNISPPAILTQHTKQKFSHPKTPPQTLQIIPPKQIPHP
ncbi:SDR family NAD(P)-dependent oxidoreductase, partial [Staphylococcus warneri]|uniref:SDR family NAD(P)-dependent oxidoreductase n=1 Tax=Staphylococcus warneri TaxID=1292 RepID=UPI0011AAD426